MGQSLARAGAAPVGGVLVLAAALVGCTIGREAAVDSTPPVVEAPAKATATARLTPPEPVLAKPLTAALVGMAAEAVVEKLGRPHHVWREPPAAVWQYRDRDCVLHVFFYPADAGLRVVHVEVRQSAGDATIGPAANPANPAYPAEMSKFSCR